MRIEATQPRTSGMPALELPQKAQEVLTEAEMQGLELLAAHPETKIHIHFSRHAEYGDPGDESMFEAPVAAADVYAVEGVGFTGKESKTLGKISRGRKIPYFRVKRRLSQDSFHYRVLEAMHDSETPAIYADMPAEHRFADLAAPARIGSLANTYLTHQKDTSNEFVQQEAKNVAYTQNVREWVALSQLGTQIGELAESDPSIAQRLQDGSLNVFMSYGTLHTGLFHKLRQLGLQPTRSFPCLPQVYHPLNALIRQKMFEGQRRDTNQKN